MNKNLIIVILIAIICLLSGIIIGNTLNQNNTKILNETDNTTQSTNNTTILNISEDTVQNNEATPEIESCDHIMGSVGLCTKCGKRMMSEEEALKKTYDDTGRMRGPNGETHAEWTGQEFEYGGSCEE